MALLPESQTVLALLNIQPAAVRQMSSHVRRSTYLAVVHYLTRYQAKPNSTNLKKIGGCIEAFNLLCTLEEWVQAYELLKLPLATGQSTA